MDLSTLALFALTVIPLICTPGPDILFTTAQGLAAGRAGALRAVAGISLGYMAHGVLSALGVAAVVAASPVLFEVLRWLGVAYLAFLAVQMIRSALSPRGEAQTTAARPASLLRGFLTSFLNPKGLLMFFSILPQFIDPASAVALQAILLSALFVAACALVYGALGIAAASVAGAGLSRRRRRALEGGAGALLGVAAGKLALS